MSLERQRYRDEPDRRFEMSRLWRERIRPRHLAREPLCIFCFALGMVIEATTVDHIKRPHGDRQLQRDPTNLQSLCPSHHSAKSAWERGRRSRPLVIGRHVDGWAHVFWTPEAGVHEGGAR